MFGFLCVYVHAELRKPEECKSEEPWQEGEESSSELEDEDEHRQNSEAEEEEEEEEEVEEEGEHTQDGTHDHMPVFAYARVRECESSAHVLLHHTKCRFCGTTPNGSALEVLGCILY